MDPFPGQRIDARYEALWRLGGGMGSVWVARDHALQRTVAIKFVASSLANDP
jgi:hypothetical protein